MSKLTVKDLLDLKGKRPLTQVNVHNESEAQRLPGGRHRHDHHLGTQ